MEVTQSFQRLIVVFLIVPSSIRMLDCVHLVVVVARSLASEITTVVAAPVPTFSVVAASRILVIKASTAIILPGRLVGSSRIFSDEFFGVVGISVVFGRGEELGNRGQSFA